MPLLLVAGAALLLVAMQPDLGTALVIAFTITRAARRRRACRCAPGASAPARGAVLVAALRR